MLGPKYALLRDEFHEARLQMTMRSGKVRRILVFFGGIDLTNETSKALHAIFSQGKQYISVDVVVGQANPRKEDIRNLCEQYPQLSFYCQVDNLAKLMTKADLAIGAGGTNTWERCALGLPSLIIAVAKNQVSIAEAVSAYGAGIYLGTHQTVSAEDILNSLESVMDSPDALTRMSLAGLKLVDAEGCTRVSELIN